MTGNLIVAAIVAFMVYWWSTQGLFSSLLNLILTILSMSVAFATYQQVAYGFLLSAVPEWGWGASLLLTFGITHLILRVITDKLIGGNLFFAPMIDKAGGAAFGLAAGCLTAGMIVIGVQMMGVADFFGHKGWEVDDNGELKPAAALWVPADSITASVAATMSGGSFAPLLGEGSINAYYPDVNGYSGLAVYASLFPQAASEKAKKSITPESISLAENSYIVTNAPPEVLATKLLLKPGRQTVVVGVNVTAQGAKGAADADGNFRATRSQVQLVYQTKDGGSGMVFPSGYMQGGQSGRLVGAGAHAYSNSTADVRHDWVFQVPADAVPQFIRVKGARLDLPELNKAGKDPAAITALLKDEGKVAAAPPKTGDDTDGTPGAPSGLPSPGAASFVKVSNFLPDATSKNVLASAGIEYNDSGLIRGRGRITGERGLGKGLQVRSIVHPENTFIVQVDLGLNQPGSLLGRAVSMAVANTQAPILIDESGNRYYAMGYLIGGDGAWDIRVEPSQPLRALAEIPIGSASAEQRIILLYQVGAGTRLTSFDLGVGQKQEINVLAQKASEDAPE